MALEAADPVPQYVDRFVTVGSLRLHYLDWGGPDKPPLILLHGIARHAHTFDHLIPELSRHYHVLALDMRGQATRRGVRTAHTWSKTTSRIWRASSPSCTCSI